MKIDYSATRLQRKFRACFRGSRAIICFTKLLACALVFSSGALNAAVINIDFKGIRNVPGPDLQGPVYEGQSPAANGTFWAAILADSRNPDGGTDLDNLTVAGTNLKDSKGNQTTIAFTTGPMGGDVGGPPTTAATSFAALFSDYIFNNSAGNSAGESSFTISGLPGTTADLYFYRTSGGVSIPGMTPSAFVRSGNFNSGNTVYFKNIPITGGSITGTFGSGTAVVTGMTIVCAGDFNPAPVSFVSEPASQTVMEGESVIFRAEVKNPQGVSFQWQRNGEIIPKATNALYTLEAAQLSDDGSACRVSAANVVTNLTYTVISSNAVLRVNPDLIAPTVRRVSTLSTIQIAVLFSERIDLSSVTNIAQYRLKADRTDGEIFAAELSEDGRTVILTTSQLAEGLSFVLFIQGVKDGARAKNEMVPAELSFQAIAYELGVVGSPALRGELLAENGGYDLSGAGSGVRGTADHFQFAKQERTGDFDTQVRIESVKSEGMWAFGGLMVRDSMQAESRFAAVLATPSVVGSFLTSRNSPGVASVSSGSFPVNHPACWLRMRRSGNLFAGFASINGEPWHELGSATVLMPPTVFFGMAAGSASTSKVAITHFRDLGHTMIPNGKPQRPPFERLAQSSRNTPLVISEIMK